MGYGLAFLKTKKLLMHGKNVPPQRLIKQTEAVLRLRDFLKDEAGFQGKLSARELREILSYIEKKAKRRTKAPPKQKR